MKRRELMLLPVIDNLGIGPSGSDCLGGRQASK
jgi:hypothetical protein